MSNVFPGVAEVLANFLLFVSILIRLDFPTFERPIKAYSGFVSLGHIDSRGALNVNSAFLISIIISIFGDKVTKKIQNYLEVRKIIRTFASFFKTLLPFEKHFNHIFFHFKVEFIYYHYVYKRRIRSYGDTPADGYR